MSACDPGRDGQPETAALNVIHLRAGTTIKALEDACLLGQWDPWTGVAHRHGGLAVAFVEMQGNLAARTIVFHRIVTEDQQELPQTMPISDDSYF